jgi:hypothetical protein
MSLKIGLYRESIWHGELELDSVFVMEPADYNCEPKGVVTYEEVRRIAKVLRRTPGIETGVIGKFAWCME